MYKIVSKTKQGAAHAKLGIECQDYIAFHDSEGVIAMALADGAGSRKDSALLADALTKELSRFIAKEYDILSGNKTTKDILYDQIMKTVKSFSDEGHEVASTLLIVAVKNEEYLAVHIGDGVIFGVDKDNAIIISEPENGDDLSETYLCESNMDETHLRIYEGAVDFDTFILTSDGIEPSLWNRNNGEIADAVFMMRKWMVECHDDQVEELVEDAMKSVFGLNTNDDMSLGIMYLE